MTASPCDRPPLKTKAGFFPLSFWGGGESQGGGVCVFSGKVFPLCIGFFKEETLCPFLFVAEVTITSGLGKVLLLYGDVSRGYLFAGVDRLIYSSMSNFACLAFVG